MFPAVSTNSQASLYATGIPMTGIDPRFSAAYGNPYLRSSTTSLPPPHLNGLSTYRSGPAPQVAAAVSVTPPTRTPPPGSSSTGGGSSQYIVSNKAQLKPGTLATHVWSIINELNPSCCTHPLLKFLCPASLPPLSFLLFRLGLKSVPVRFTHPSRFSLFQVRKTTSIFKFRAILHARQKRQSAKNNVGYVYIIDLKREGKNAMQLKK